MTEHKPYEMYWQGRMAHRMRWFTTKLQCAWWLMRNVWMITLSPFWDGTFEYQRQYMKKQLIKQWDRCYMLEQENAWLRGDPVVMYLRRGVPQ